MTYEIMNPYFLADTFVFKVVKDKDSCLYGKTVYVKVNTDNKIEEIGIDIEKRMHNIPLDKLIEKSNEATKEHKQALRCIGSEYFAFL